MAIIMLSVWILFVAAFLMVKIFFPVTGVGVRRVKDIKKERSYDEDGYDEHGFSSLGYHRNGTRYDDDGYDRYGFDANGNPRSDPVGDEAATRQSGYDDEPERGLKVSGTARTKIIAVAMAVITVLLVGAAMLDYASNLTCLFGHNYVKTFCEQPEKCSRCGLEKDQPVGHQWTEADCEHPKTCSFCRKQEGEPLGHDTDTGICGRCGKKVD